MLSYVEGEGLWHSKFAHSVVVVVTGAAGAQATNMAFAPIITGLYGPDAFGVLGAFMAILAALASLAALSYPIAIVLPKDDFDVRLLVKASLSIASLVCVAAALASFFWKADS